MPSDGIRLAYAIAAGKQYVTAANAYEAIQMAKALYGRLLISEGAAPVL